VLGLVAQIHIAKAKATRAWRHQTGHAVEECRLAGERYDDAQKVLQVLAQRFAKYGLRLHPEKTRLVAFGRSALDQAERDGAKSRRSISWASRIGRPTNYHSLYQFFQGVRRFWRHWLNRPTRGKTFTWVRYEQLLARHPLLRPRITHAWSR